MTSTESQTPTHEDFVRWGTAPEDRQCRYTFASGRHCHRWSIRGHQYCQEHGRWMECRVDGPIEVPLMEDPQAVELVASQTVRAVGWGHIPPANGRAILHGCRVVQTGFAQNLAEAKFRLKCHTLGLDANQFLPARGTDSGAGAPLKPGVGLSGIEAPSPDSNQDALYQGTTSSRAVQPQQMNRASAPEGSLSPSEEPTQSLKGHGFSRAVESHEVDGALAPEGTPSHPGEAAQDDPATEPAPTPYPLSPTPSAHPLDDLPPAPRPKSVCEPCVDALKAGADESLVDCRHCPAHNSGNLRAPQLPDPRNTPEPAYDSRTAPSPETPPFRDLKNNWDRDLRRAANQRLRPNDRRPGQTYEEILASRARPYDDYLRAPRTSPPPPIPNPDAH